MSLVKKYEISEEDYLKRDNNFRQWKEEQKKKDPRRAAAAARPNSAKLAQACPNLALSRDV